MCYKNVKWIYLAQDKVYLKVVVKSAVKTKLNVVLMVWLNSTFLGHDAVSIGFRGHLGEVSAFMCAARTVQLLPNQYGIALQ